MGRESTRAEHERGWGDADTPTRPLASLGATLPTKGEGESEPGGSRLALPTRRTRPLQPHHRRIQRLKKRAPVLRRKGLRPACRLARRAQTVHQIARRQRHADALGRERAAIGAEGFGTRLHRAIRERHIVCNDDGPRPRALGDPVVGDIHPRRHDHALDQLVPRHIDEAVGDHEHFEAVARCDAVDLVLHRTGIGIDENDDRFAHGPFNTRRAAPGGTALPLSSAVAAGKIAPPLVREITRSGTPGGVSSPR